MFQTKKCLPKNYDKVNRIYFIISAHRSSITLKQGGERVHKEKRIAKKEIPLNKNN